jgi:hypothetical protein
LYICEIKFKSNAGGAMGWLVGKALRLAKGLTDFLVDFALLPGTNILGLAFVLAIGFLMTVFQIKRQSAAEGALVMLVGMLASGLDVGIRKLLGHQSVLEYDKGARFVYLPLWIWGLVWVVAGLVLVLWATIS